MLYAVIPRNGLAAPFRNRHGKEASFSVQYDQPGACGVYVERRAGREVAVIAGRYGIAAQYIEGRYENWRTDPKP